MESICAFAHNIQIAFSPTILNLDFLLDVQEQGKG